MKLDEQNINNLKEGLIRKVQYCMNTQDKDPELVVGIHDYIEYINNQPMLDNLVIKKIQDSARKKIDKLKTLEKKIIKELDLVFKEIKRSTTTKEKAEIKDWIGEESSFNIYLKYKDGTISSTRGKTHDLHNTISDILNNLFKIRGRNDFSDYMKIEEKNNLQYFNYFLSKHYSNYAKMEKSLQNEKEVSAWGSFDELYICYQAIEGYIGNQANTTALQSQRAFYASAFISLKENKTTFQYNPLVSNNKKGHLQRLNLRLLDELDRFEKINLLNKGSLEKTGKLEPTYTTDNRDYFEIKEKKLINLKNNKESQGEVNGQSLRLLELFLEDKQYSVTREKLLTIFKSKDIIQTAKSELSSRIMNVAVIEPIRNPDNNTKVSHYKLSALKG